MQLHHPTVGQLFAERYQIEKLLGKGGMGQVYLALDTLLEGTPVALKILSAHLCRDKAYMKQFLGEIQLARQITHPNVARTFEAGSSEGQLYFVMEFVKAGELSELLGRGGMPLSHAQPIINQICDGLAAIHEVGVVHGDLKPANLMLAIDGRVKITDFGIARNSASLTSKNEIIGSPHYMAPEIWRGEGGGARSDLYALGIIIYEILTGRKPFELENDSALMFNHLSTEPPSPVELKPLLPDWMNQLILGLMAKDPGERISSVQEVRAIIDRSVNGSSETSHYQIDINMQATSREADPLLSWKKPVKNSVEGSPDNPHAPSGTVNNSIDNLQASLMYQADQIDQSPLARLANWLALVDQDKFQKRAITGGEAVLCSTALGWTLLYPMGSLYEYALSAASRSGSSFAMILAILFTFACIAALLTVPLVLIGRCFLTRLQTATLWGVAAVMATLLLSLFFCVHFSAYSSLLDPNGLTVFSQKALHSMRNVITGGVPTMLLLPFQGLDNPIMNVGFTEPSLNSKLAELLFSGIIIAFYVLEGCILHAFLLRPLGRYVRHWAASLPAMLLLLIALESCYLGFITLDKAERIDLPWLATIQLSFSPILIKLAFFNWIAIWAYVSFLMRPLKCAKNPWEQSRYSRQVP